MISGVMLAILIGASPAHSVVAANQTSYDIHPVKINSSSLAMGKPSQTFTMIPYHTKSHSTHLALKALSSTLQSAKVYTPSQAPLINTGTSAIQVQSGGFDGLGQVASGGYAPPDVAASAGPTDIFEMVNLEGEIWTKSGTAVSSFSMWSFFGINATDSLSDPRIIYDNLSGRWFASILDISSDSVYFGASSSSDPTSTWNMYHVAFADCPDQPKIGVSSDKFVITGDDYTNHCGLGGSPSFAGEEYWVISKSQIMSGSTLTSYTQVQPDSTKFGVVPARPLSSTSTVYLASVDTGGSVNNLHYFTITGTASSPTLQEVNLAIQATSTPPQALEPGAGYKVDTGDGRLLDAVWYQNKMWVSFNDGCVPSGDTIQRSCLRLVQVDTTGPTVLQDHDIGASGYYYYYPAVSFDSLGNLGVIFGMSSSSVYPSLAVTGQPTYDSANTFESPVVLKTGSTIDTTTRYGDYFSAMTDPSNGHVIWVGGEYHSGSPWSTFIGSMEVNSAPVANAGTAQTVGPGTVVTLNGSASSDPDGDSLTYSWTQSSGPSVTLANANTVHPSFTTPSVSVSTSMIFQLAVNDGISSSASSVTITDAPCTPPSSGDWTVTSSCTISSTVTAPANVVVQSGVVLTIPSGLKMNIDFTHYHLLVKSGGGVLIKAGGAIN